MPVPPPPPSKLTETLAKAVVADVEAGLAVTLAVEAAGITREALYSWLRQGRADAEAGVPPGWGDGQSRHRALLDSLACARARYGRALALDIASGEKDHRALAYLERTRLARYYSDRALDEELLAERPEPAASEAPTDPGAVTVELVRCPSCGDDQLPGKRYCGNCGKPMAAKEAP